MTAETLRRLGRELLISGLALGACLLALTSWSGFTADPGAALRPLVVVAVLLAVVGAVLRAARAPALVTLLAQMLITALASLRLLGGSLLPTAATVEQARGAVEAATLAAGSFAPPVPASGGGVTALLVAGGLLLLLLVDLVAGPLRRVALVGLPLLAIYSLPVGIVETGVPRWTFALAAAAYLALLVVHEDDVRARWGHRVPPIDRRSGLPALPVAGAVLGVAALAVALAAPLVLPTTGWNLLDRAPGWSSGTSDEISIRNPMTDLRRDLQRGEDVPLVQVRTDGPAPSYLRISVLNRFTSNQWSSGDRELPDDQTARDALPDLEGVDPTVRRTESRLVLEATDEFDSTWLPVPAPLAEVDADPRWKFDDRTIDFIAAADDLTTRGQSWSATAVELALDAELLGRARASGAGRVDSEFLELPAALSPEVQRLARGVTEGAEGPYEQALLLQDWFRESGGFTYDLEADAGNGGDLLEEFLVETRTGYCEQFASAMAAMSRELGIPARVAVGFLRSEQVAPNTYEFSAHDLHAWPELYLDGAGWVRFEPTPADRAPEVPSYADGEVETPPLPLPEESPTTEPAPTPTPSATPTPTPSSPATPREEPSDPAEAAPGSNGSDDDARGLPAVLAWAAGAVLLLLAAVALVLLPARVRARRRSARRAQGTAEAAWTELRDEMIDLGGPWPEGLSPATTARTIVDCWPGGADDASLRALDTLVQAVERERYAAPGAASASGGADRLFDAVGVVTERWASTMTPAQRRRARRLPRSLRRRGARAGAAPAQAGALH